MAAGDHTNHLSFASLSSQCCCYRSGARTFDNDVVSFGQKFDRCIEFGYSYLQ